MAHFYYYLGKKCCHLNRGSFFVKRSDSNTTCGNPLFVNTPIDEIQKWYSNNFMFEIFFFLHSSVLLATTAKSSYNALPPSLVS